MKNARVEGTDLVYDCDAPDCETPGEPHRISLTRIMASLEATFREFECQKDPRTEDLAALLQYVWQTAYPGATADSQVPTANTDWDTELSQLILELSAHYVGSSLTHKHDHKKTKSGPKLLN